MTESIEVVCETDRAQALLHPARLELLEAMGEPSSAAGLARRLGLPRQRLNYHLRELEEQGFVALVEERKRGSVSERIYQRTSESFAISIDALGALGSRPSNSQDRYSSAHQIAVASEAIADVAALREAASAAGKKLPTFSLDVDVRFANAGARSEFTQKLADKITRLVREYHDDRAPRGRAFKFYIGAYPVRKTAAK